MADEIIIQYKADVTGLRAELKTVQSDLKTTETVATASGAKVTESFKKTEVATESLRSRIRKLKEELANATDPKDIERLAKETGKLTDQMQDAGDAAKIFASESKFEQVATGLGSIVGKLKNLDFKGAADQAKLLAAAAKGITFKETIAAVKDLGSTFLNVAKSILANPFILTLTAVAGLAIAIKSYTDSLKENTAVIEENNAAIDKIRANVRKLSDDYDAATQRRLKSEGLFTDIDEKRNAALKKFTDLQERQYTELKDAAKKYSEEIGVEDANNIDAKLRKQNELRTRLKELATAQAKELSEAGKVLNEEIAAANSEAFQVDKKRREAEEKEKLAKQKALNDKLIAERERLRQVLISLDIKNDEANLKSQATTDEQRIELARSAAIQEILVAEKSAIDKGVNRLEAENITQNALSNIRKNFDQQQTDRIKTENEKEFDEAISFAEKLGDAEAKVVQDNLKKRLDDEKAAAQARKQVEQEAAQAISSIIGTLAQINSNFVQQKIGEAQESSDAELVSLQKKYDNELISKEDFEAEKNKINEEVRLKEAKLKKDAFEFQKQASLIQAIIATAQGVATALTGDPYTVVARVAIAAAIGAAQIALIASQPTPKFEKGGRVGGERHSAGGTLIEAEKDEFVVRRNAAIENNSLLNAINSGKTEKYILENYIAPALRSQQKKNSDLKQSSFADNLAKSIMINSGGFKDSNLLDSLKHSRKSDRENILFLIKELKGSSYNPRKW